MADEWGYGRSGREQQEARPFDPSWRDEMAIWLQRQLDGGQDRNVSRQVRNLVGSDGLGHRQFAAADFAALPFPGVIAALLGVDVGDDVRRGDYMSGVGSVASAALPAGVQRWGGRFLGNVSRRSDAGIDGKDYWTKQHSLRSKIPDNVDYDNVALRQTYQPTANGRYAGDAAQAGRVGEFRGLDPVGDAASRSMPVPAGSRVGANHTDPYAGQWDDPWMGALAGRRAGQQGILPTAADANSAQRIAAQIEALRKFHSMDKGNSTVHGIAAALGGAGAASYMDDY